jgi:hypothetical protein
VGDGAAGARAGRFVGGAAEGEAMNVLHQIMMVRRYVQ